MAETTSSWVANVSVLHPVAMALCLFSGILILVLPRKYAFVPLLVTALIIPLQQRLVIATLDFTLVRILILFGLSRVFIRTEYKWLTLNSIDKAMILWVLARIVTYTLLWQTPLAFINRLGGSLDALGVYLLARILVRNLEDIERTVKVLVLVCVAVGIAMANEQLTQRNFFSVFGGVPEITYIRDGKLRSQGPFGHSILAGTLGATMMPIFWGFRWRRRGTAILGLVAATIITWVSSSSGPVLVYVAAIVGLCAWLAHDHMRKIRWGIVLAVVSLHIVMKAPVWALLWRFSVFGGSTGFHRYRLFDQFVNRFGEWWLVGTESTAHWGYYLFDITNMYVQVAIEGGLITLILFILIIVRCFRGVGLAIQEFKDDLHTQKLFWCFGGSLFAHVVGFWGVSYWDQITVLWYCLLAMIAAISTLSHRDCEEVQEVKRAWMPDQGAFLIRPI